MLEQVINIDRMEHTLALFGSFDENIKPVSYTHLLRQNLPRLHLPVSQNLLPHPLLKLRMKVALQIIVLLMITPVVEIGMVHGAGINYKSNQRIL